MGICTFGTFACERALLPNDFLVSANTPDYFRTYPRTISATARILRLYRIPTWTAAKTDENKTFRSKKRAHP